MPVLSFSYSSSLKLVNFDFYTWVFVTQVASCCESRARGEAKAVRLTWAKGAEADAEPSNKIASNYLLIQKISIEADN